MSIFAIVVGTIWLALFVNWLVWVLWLGGAEEIRKNVGYH